MSMCFHSIAICVRGQPNALSKGTVRCVRNSYGISAVLKNSPALYDPLTSSAGSTLAPPPQALGEADRLPLVGLDATDATESH